MVTFAETTTVQIQQAIEIARRLNLIGPVAEQPEYSMVKREKFEVEFEPLWRWEGYGRRVITSLKWITLMPFHHSTVFSALGGGL